MTPIFVLSGLIAVLAVLLILAVFAMYRMSRQREAERGGREEYCELLRWEIAQLAARQDAIQKALRVAGGIGKRIAECREIAETLQRHEPEIFQKESGLIYWIEATDQFLVELHNAVGRDPNDERVANSYSGEIYRQIHAATGLPIPPGALAHLATT